MINSGETGVSDTGAVRKPAANRISAWKAWYRLVNYESLRMLRIAGLLGLGMIVAPLLLVRGAMKHYSAYSVQERFEDIFSDSGGILVIVLLIAAMLVYFLKTVYADYWGSKSIYTLLTLPTKRETLYFGKLGALAVCLAVLWAALLIGVWLCYAYVEARQSGVEGGKYVMHNGLFLAFIRSSFLRMVLPMSAVGWLSTLSMALTLMTAIYYGALCERSKRYWGSLPLLAAGWALVRAIAARFADPLFAPSPFWIVGDSVVLLAFSVYFIWHSIRLMRKGAIA